MTGLRRALVAGATMTMLTLAALAAVVLTAAQAAAQETHQLPAADAAVYNLAGRVEVVRGSGSDVVVRIDRGGSDAGMLSVETGTIRGVETLRIIYPADEIVYPEIGRGSSNTVRVRDDGTFSGGGGRTSRVRIRGSGGGLEAWADLVIEVPPGSGFALYLAAGDVEARGVDGRLRIDTGSGTVEAIDISGSLSIDTGSGGIFVRDVEGNLDVDTGSGRVDVAGVSGEVLNVDTGSGRVTGADISVVELIVDTGSGAIELSAVSASDVSLDTGSGAVELRLLTDIESLDIDTGSGSVTVHAPSDLGARVEIETGSGGIDVDFPVEVRTIRRDSLIGTIGDGRGRIVIDTGSGSIRLIRR